MEKQIKLQHTRALRAKLNIVFSLVSQAAALVCGFIVPRLLINTFGSEAYGATASILQFLSYIVLLEGGIGGVARAVLYKPLAQRDFTQITQMINEVKCLFRIIGCIFAVYVLIIACGFKSISHFQYYDWAATFVLVIVISLSTFAQYFLGISYILLLQADQKSYITHTINTVALILSTILVVWLVHTGCGLITVKFVSALVFVLRPVVMYFYVRNHYPLVPHCPRDKSVLAQKWSGLGQHIAFFLHTNTDVVILTLCANLKVVAVYAVYNMITTQIERIITSFTTGMEALFGDMLARQEIAALNRVFGYYETLISCIALPLCSVTLLLIVPFVKLYTSQVTDANYVQPLFAAILVISVFVYCLRAPYHALVIAAGHFKQTQGAAYAEAFLNMGLSILLVYSLGLVGVALGTLCAVLFRFGYYVFYLSRTLIQRPVQLFVKRCMCNVLAFVGIVAVGYAGLKGQTLHNYFQWALAGGILTLVAGGITGVVFYLFYRQDFKFIFKRLKI